MLESLKHCPRTAGAILGISLGVLVEATIGEVVTMLLCASAISLYALAAIRGWF